MFSPLRVWAASLQPHRHNSDEEDRDSNYSDLVDASNDKDEERRSGKEEDEESEDGHVSDMDASVLLVGAAQNVLMLAYLCMHLIQFILQWRKRSILTDLIKMDSTYPDLKSGFVLFLGPA